MVDPGSDDPWMMRINRQSLGHRLDVEIRWKKELRNRNTSQHSIKSDILIAQIHIPKLECDGDNLIHVSQNYAHFRHFEAVGFPGRFQVYKDPPICSTQKQHPSPEEDSPFPESGSHGSTGLLCLWSFESRGGTVGCQQCCDGKCACTLCTLVILETVDGSEIPFPTSVGMVLNPW